MRVWAGNTEIEAELCRGFFSRLRGLMWSRPRNVLIRFPREGRNRAAIHSFFVFFPFTAVFLNSEREVVDTRRMKPFRFYRPRRAAAYVLEICEPIGEDIDTVLFENGEKPLTSPDQRIRSLMGRRRQR